MTMRSLGSGSLEISPYDGRAWGAGVGALAFLLLLLLTLPAWFPFLPVLLPLRATVAEAFAEVGATEAEAAPDSENTDNIQTEPFATPEPEPEPQFEAEAGSAEPVSQVEVPEVAEDAADAESPVEPSSGVESERHKDEL